MESPYTKSLYHSRKRFKRATWRDDYEAKNADAINEFVDNSYARQEGVKHRFDPSVTLPSKSVLRGTPAMPSGKPPQHLSAPSNIFASSTTPMPHPSQLNNM